MINFLRETVATNAKTIIKYRKNLNGTQTNNAEKN